MLNTNSAKFMNFINVLQNPSNVVPKLADEEIYTIIVDSVRAYLEQEINLETFVDIVIKLKLFSGIKENANEDIKKALNTLSGLSEYLNFKKRNNDEINAILIEALKNISQKQ